MRLACTHSNLPSAQPLHNDSSLQEKEEKEEEKEEKEEEEEENHTYPCTHLCHTLSADSPLDWSMSERWYGHSALLDLS